MTIDLDNFSYYINEIKQLAFEVEMCYEQKSGLVGVKLVELNRKIEEAESYIEQGYIDEAGEDW